jgi:hypothetical protein
MSSVCPCVRNSYLRSYLRKSATNQWVFSSRPHNTNTQDELLSPYPQRLRPPSPWKHPPRTRIVSPRLPMSLLHATRKAAFAHQGRQQRRNDEGRTGDATMKGAAARRRRQNRWPDDEGRNGGATMKAAAAGRGRQQRHDDKGRNGRIVSPRLPMSLLHATRKAAFARQGRQQRRDDKGRTGGATRKAAAARQQRQKTVARRRRERRHDGKGSGSAFLTKAEPVARRGRERRHDEEGSGGATTKAVAAQQSAAAR